jgi:hypothetical protein
MYLVTCDSRLGVVVVAPEWRLVRLGNDVLARTFIVSGGTWIGSRSMFKRTDSTRPSALQPGRMGLGIRSSRRRRSRFCGPSAAM